KFFTGLQNFRGRTAGNNRFQLAPVTQTAAKFRVVDEFANRRLTDFDFVVAWAFYMAAQADDARAGVVRRAELGKFHAAHRDDVLHVAKRLDVVDDGRAHPQAEHRRKIRRFDARIRPLAFERFDEAGFLAANVSARAAMDVNFQIVTGAENVLAEEIILAGFLDGAIQNFRAFGHFAADVNIGELHIVREAGDDHAFDQLMRILVHDLTILERARLGFVGVANEINRLAALAINEAPLEAAGKTSAATAAQAGDFHV